jgi:hypothetical protein
LRSPPHRQRGVLLGIVVELFGGGEPARLGRIAAIRHVDGDFRSSFVEHRDALLDALEGLHDLALEPDKDADCVLVGAASDLFGLVLRLADDPAALAFGLLGEAALIDEEGGLLLGAGDDALGLFLGFLDDPLALGVDPLGGADLLGDGDTQLVDEPERGGLVDDDVVRQGEAPAVRDDRLEALDEEDDVDGSALRWRSTGTAGR